MELLVLKRTCLQGNGEWLNGGPSVSPNYSFTGFFELLVQVNLQTEGSDDYIFRFLSIELSDINQSSS